MIKRFAMRLRVKERPLFCNKQPFEWRRTITQSSHTLDRPFSRATQLNVLRCRLTSRGLSSILPIMSHSVEEIRSKAMRLSLSERASLAHDLILSLDQPEDFELGPEQESEIRRRVTMVREGIATGRPASAVFADIRAKYG